MKPAFCITLCIILLIVLAGCSDVSATVQPTQELIIASPINLQTMATDTIATKLTPALVVTKTPSPTASLTNFPTLDPKSVEQTLQPLLQDPMNCKIPCFWGITPGKTNMDQARLLFSHLGFSPFEGTDPNIGRDFYSIAYASSSGHDSYVTLYPSNNLVENIVVKPVISKQKEGGRREWIAYSPETLIKKYGQPSRVEFNLTWPGGGGSEIIMNMYFDALDLVVQYTGENILPSSNHSPRLCPLTAPFDYVRLWLGPNPPNPPLVGIPLEKATSLTIEQFTQILLGDPKQACFVVNGNVFK